MLDRSSFTGSFDAIGRIAAPKAIVPAAWVTALALRRREGGPEIAVATSLAVVAANVLKRSIDRCRPRVLNTTPFESFPSGHSAASTAYLVGIAMAAPPEQRPTALAAACLGAAAVSTLRVLARQHWPTDVLAGDALGVLAVASVHAASRAIRRATERRPVEARA